MSVFGVAISGAAIILLIGAIIVGWSFLNALCIFVLAKICCHVEFLNEHAKGTALAIIVVSTTITIALLVSIGAQILS